MIFSERRWQGLLLLALAGCTAAGKPEVPPRLDMIAPATTFVGDAAEIVLSGEAFTPKATVRWGGGTGDVVADAAFQVFAGTERLLNVTWVDAKTLRAVLPVGLAAGKYAVKVVDPYGRSTELPAALEVRGRSGASLSATLTAALNTVPVLKELTVHLDVTNTGDTAVDALAALQLGAAGTAAVIALGVMGGSTRLAPGQKARFELTWVSTSVGDVVLSAEVRGVDAFTGASVRAGPLTTGVLLISPPPGEVTTLAIDPFTDGTAFATVFSYAGRVWLGPRKTGLGVVSMAPDGSAPAAHAFSFARDTIVGQVHKNSSAAPYPSIGTAGCAINTQACGPDNENGRALFFAGTLGGAEWLGAVGVRLTGQLSYLYLSNSTGPALDFRYVDLGMTLSGSTQAASAAHFFNGRLYAGFADIGGKRPYLIALLTPPPSPGLDATISNQPGVGVDVLQLEADALPGLGQGAGNSATVQLIDSLTDFNDRLYVANNGGIVRSTTNAPRSPAVALGDWSSSTPTAAAFTARTSSTTSKTSELLPSDKAFPQLAAFQGRLYAARNTTAGPQLWACVPGTDGFCAPGEWAQIAANTTGDALLSQFNDAANTTIGLLAATPTALYVGFNNAQGIQLFKATRATPSAGSDFTGANGCVAGVAGCEGLGSNGLGAPTINRQIFDARALTFGGSTFIYLVTGNGTLPARVFRIGG